MPNKVVGGSFVAPNNHRKGGAQKRGWKSVPRAGPGCFCFYVHYMNYKVRYLHVEQSFTCIEMPLDARGWIHGILRLQNQ